METIKAKLKEYLAMDHELEFGEFNEYYNLVLAELNANYGSYDAEALLSMRYVLSTVCVNAQSWATRRDKNSKKYKKIRGRIPMEFFQCKKRPHIEGAFTVWLSE